MHINYLKLKIITLIIIFLTISVSLSACSANILSVSSTENIENLENENYDLLILTINKFKGILRILAEHKEKHNIKTKIEDVNTIFKNDDLEGRDDQEKIKYFIKEELDNYIIRCYRMFYYRPRYIWDKILAIKSLRELRRKMSAALSLR